MTTRCMALRRRPGLRTAGSEETQHGVRADRRRRRVSPDAERMLTPVKLSATMPGPGMAFAYIYSHDANSAYEPADRMVLARAPIDGLRQCAAYEFFRGVDARGTPVWTKDIGARAAVFTCPRGCYRSAVTYNAGLRRYLWSQTLPGDDARFQGGFGVYDAPEPWGPWTSVYVTERWDVGPGETSSFPTRWMSPDGRTLHLVFSGDDAFSVRRARVILR
jgi:hypothetical protein